MKNVSTARWRRAAIGSPYYRRSPTKSGTRFAELQNARWPESECVTESNSAQNLNRKNRLRQSDAAIAEPKTLLRLRSLVGLFLPCNRYSRQD
jgi:hypothetical protein